MRDRLLREARWDLEMARTGPGNELAVLRARVAELEARAAIDERQCDEMTAEAGRLAVRVAELESLLAMHGGGAVSELRPRRQYSVEAMPLTEEDREAVAEYVASELAAVPDPPSRAVREDAALRAALSAVAWRREVEAQCAVTRSVLESNARLAERVAELETPTVEVRRNEDGSLDEVVASRANVHLEQMSVDCWWLRIGEVEITIHTLHRAHIVANVEEVEP